MRGGQGPVDGNAIHSPPRTRVGRLEREEPTEQDVSDPEANESSSSDEVDEMDVEAPGEEMDVDSSDEENDEAIFSGDGNEVAPDEQRYEGTTGHKQDEVAAVNTGTMVPGNSVPEPKMERIGPHGDEVGRIESDKMYRPIGLYAPPPIPPRPLGHRRGGSINMAQLENLKRPRPAARPGHNHRIDNLMLTPSLLPGKVALDEEEEQFFSTFYDQVAVGQAKSRLRASSTEMPRNKRSRPNGSQPQHPHSSSQLPVTRIVVHRPQSAVPCNRNSEKLRVLDMRHDKETPPTISASYAGAPGSPSPAYDTPAQRASSATIAASPSLAHAISANQHLVRTSQSHLIDCLTTDPTAYNTDAHVWNWSCHTYEPALPDLLDKEKFMEVPSDTFEGGFDSLHEVDFLYDSPANF